MPEILTKNLIYNQDAQDLGRDPAMQRLLGERDSYIGLQDDLATIALNETVAVDPKILDRQDQEQTDEPRLFTKGQHIQSQFQGEVVIEEASDESITFNFEKTDSLSSETRLLLKGLPLMKKLVTIHGDQIKAPTIGAMIAFKDEYFKPLGSASIEPRLVEGGELEVEKIIDCWADGKFAVGDDPDYYVHDLTYHGSVVLAMHKDLAPLFVQIAQTSKSLRENDPFMARSLAVAFGQGYESYFRPEDIGEPEKIPNLISFFIKFKEGVLDVLEQNIDYAPVEKGIVEPTGLKYIDLNSDKYPHIMSWLKWQKDKAPAYFAALSEAMSAKNLASEQNKDSA